MKNNPKPKKVKISKREAKMKAIVDEIYEKYGTILSKLSRE